MKALIQELQQKVGLTEEQAIKSVETIKEFIQSKLPPMMHGLVDNFMGSMDDDEDFMDEGSGNREWESKASNLASEATEKLEDFKEEAEEFAKAASEKLGEFANKAEQAADEAINKLKDIVNDAKSKDSNK